MLKVELESEFHHGLGKVFVELKNWIETDFSQVDMVVDVVFSVNNGLDGLVFGFGVD